MSNHLANETSPYLLQHADNPVDWYPWGSQALEKSRQEDKPIFLSIGYASCHWCHVMAHESFEDPGIASLLNENFVSIKVDREQRPDLDSIYMNFVVATLGSGGWPLSIFLTPDSKPFYGGTYFPPVRQHNLPAFREVLTTVARLWKTDRAAILLSSDNITQSLQPRLKASQAGESLNLELLMQVIQTLSNGYDWQNGGWGAAPKFPQPMLIEFLLCQASRGDTTSLNMATHTLRSMAQGGMYDVLGGGFARYSVDPYWLVPHFEKMLYDNALLARAYLHAYQLTGETLFRQVCSATLDFILRELTHPTGGFFSSLDADSEGVEGKYYAWSPQEVMVSLDSQQDAELFNTAYGVTKAGNFDGRTILRQTLADDMLAERFHLDKSSISSRLEVLRHQLLEARNQRVRPLTDDKVVVSWNSLALAALADAGRALDQPVYINAAIRNASFILDHLLVGGRLMRSWREGVADHPAYLEDYAGLAVCLLTLYQADPNLRWYQAALQLMELILGHFTHPAGGFFDTADDHEALLYRPKDLQDNATPSGNAMALTALQQLAAYEGRSDLRQLANEMLALHQKLFLRYPSAFAQWLCAADFALGPSFQLAILGDDSDPYTQELLSAVWQHYHPRLVLAASPHPIPPGSPALLNDRIILNGKPTAYVCQNFVCRLPVNDPEAMMAQLSI